MSAERKRAAQYIRMSTDRQDLSPLIQKDAIERFAAANSLEVVSSYEDEGKSGVQISNRPKLRQLLKDVASNPPFSEILVYDVSRWGRFQDADAGAYYEYHCRLHGVQVRYVSESFSNDQNPASVLIKSMRRVMAGEYSRDIAWKSRAGQQRVISMGYHMGALPPLGYRRCSISADGTHRIMLEHGQRKSALTDRIEWILGPEPEVALVRSMCYAYAEGYALEEIAGLAKAEGWRTAKHRPVTTQSIKILLRHEALIGNFVWGAKSTGGKIITCAPSRLNGSVPRIIDDATWNLIQTRFTSADARAKQYKRREHTDGLTPKRRRPRQLPLEFDGGPVNDGYRRSIGSAQQLRDHTREFGRAVCTAISNTGTPAAFDPRTNVLTFWGLRVRVRLMWPTDGNNWTLGRSRTRQQTDHTLIARMLALRCPLDFFILPPDVTPTASRAVSADVPADWRPYWCNTGEATVRRLRSISAPVRDLPKAQAQVAHP